MRKTIVFIFFLLGGTILGTFVGRISENISILSWLGINQSFGIGYPQPIIIDLTIIKFNFGFILNMNLSQIIFILISIILYKKVTKEF